MRIDVDITFEQARVFDAVARLGTIQKAAAELNRGHSAVLYSVQGLEEQTGLALFDRSGHRNRVSVEGEVVLKFCRKLLATRRELAVTCYTLKEGWEPSLRMIYDEVVDFNFIGAALFDLNAMKPPTEVRVLSAHLDEVESLFQSQRGDITVTIVPFTEAGLPARALRPFRMRLVAHRAHPLGAGQMSKLTPADLNRHTFVAIKTASVALGLSTDTLDFDSKFFVNSFVTKKLAIMNRLGFGWLPDYLIQAELKKKVLLPLKTQIENEVVLKPKLYHRPEELLGRAARALLQALVRRA